MAGRQRPFADLGPRAFAPTAAPRPGGGADPGGHVIYIDALRGVPLLLVVLLISGGLGALASEDVIPDWIGLPRWLGMPDPFWYGVFAITLTYGAYIAEVYRAGIDAVPGGQMQAARSLGNVLPAGDAQGRCPSGDS